MQEMPESQPSKCEVERNHECMILQQRIETACIGNNRTMKMEMDVFNPPHTAEIQFLRSRVRELEKEKAEMAAENQRLHNMLVKEIPGLLSTMWQTLGQANQPPHPAVSPQAVSTATGRGESYTYTHHHSMSGHFGQGFSSPLHHQPMSNRSAITQDNMNESMSNFGPDMAISEDGDLELSDITENDDPHSSLCGSASNLPVMRTCSETHCVNGTGHVNQVEVYPGSGVFCEMRSWHAANQTQSPTAMARTLLLGVFDMDTLLNSNLRGGRSRRPTFPNHRTALDPHKLNAIYNATLARFPLARKGQIGTGINSKLSEIRFRSRRANRDPSYL
ncbi:uncharacterized protein [Salmo salar]|uniref:BEN domain-containing protein n=1 Tax=Salmo salar TaxID=8030 RepID=A0A1S3RY84_SALSA|nr:uncharacterized protein LOC106605778 [Salmo salar]|eukprot:XP_014057193.1 PREDICTED: uncharacterized protein LOC106605778 [Salmo salar]